MILSFYTVYEKKEATALFISFLDLQPCTSAKNNACARMCVCERERERERERDRQTDRQMERQTDKSNKVFYLLF